MPMAMAVAGLVTGGDLIAQLKDKELNYGLRFVFCGSEERGLLGSKAYVRDHESELEKAALNINLDMIGTYLGKFIACISAEDKLAHYISYMAAEVGFPVEAFIPVTLLHLRTRVFRPFPLPVLQAPMWHQSTAAMI